MIRHIINKEILAHLIDFKIYPISIIILALFIVNGLHFNTQYNEQKDYFDRQANSRRQEALNRFYHVPPDPASFCCASNDKQLSVNFWIRLEEMGLWQQNGEKGNIFLPSAITPDWTFIIIVLFSLLLILLSYNTISDEIETKTLLLNCSNPVSRWELFLGKCISMLLIASVILIVSMLSGLITIILLGDISVDSALMGRLAVFYALSLLYGSIFILIGMGSSVLVRRSTVSLLVSMSAWLFLIVLLPESIEVIIKKYQDNPSDYELTQQYEQMDMSIYRQLAEIRQENKKHDNLTDPEVQQLLTTIRSRIVEIGNEHSKKQRDLADYILQLQVNRYTKRQKWKKFTPAILFREIAEKIMYSGNFRFLDFIERARQFSIRFQDDMTRRYNVTKSNYSSVRAEINGEFMIIEPEVPKMEYNGMELEVSNSSLVDSLRAALKEVLMLLCMSLFIGIWGFIGFVRCDIR